MLEKGLLKLGEIDRSLSEADWEEWEEATYGCVSSRGWLCLSGPFPLSLA
jgi:hypothetical protein